EVVRGVVMDTLDTVKQDEKGKNDTMDRWRKKAYNYKTSKRRFSDGDPLASVRVFGSLLGDGHWETCAACLNAWQNWFRRVKFERNRQSMRAALVWNDPGRASAVIRARETLAKSDQVTWLSVQLKVNEDEKVQSKLTSPPKLRRESGNIFSALVQELREQLVEQLRHHIALVNDAEWGVVQRWIIKEKTKETGCRVAVGMRQAQVATIAGLGRFDPIDEAAPNTLFSDLAFEPQRSQALFQQLYITSLALSVEKTATTLAQMFADTSHLMIRIMAMPVADDATGEAKLATSPNHSDVQAHLNALLDGVVAAAGRAPIVWQPGRPSDEVVVEDMIAEIMEQREKEDKYASAALQRSLAKSPSYRAAVSDLDAQLRRSFHLVERRLQAVQRQLDPMLLGQSAILSRLYLDRQGLFQQIQSVAVPLEGDAATGHVPAECQRDFTPLNSPFLADFTMFWLSRPQQMARQQLPEKISVLLMNLFYSLAKVIVSSKVNLQVAPLPPATWMQHRNSMDLAACLSPDAYGRRADSALATIIAEAVEGRSAGCAALHTALALLVDGSGSFLELLRPQQLLRPELFLRTVQGTQYELSLVEGLCEWLADLQRVCEQWEQVVQNMRALSQCGPFALDVRYFSFIAEQTSPALLSLSVYATNIYGVPGRKTGAGELWEAPMEGLATSKDIYELVLRVQKPVETFEDMVSELETGTPLIAALASVTRSHLFTQRLPDVRAGRSISVEEMPERFMLGFQEQAEHDEKPSEESEEAQSDAQAARREQGRAHGVGHAYGGLSTGTMQFLCLKTDDVFQELQESLDQVLRTLPARSGPFQEMVREESLAVAEAAAATRQELEEQLAPSGALAIDARCSLTRVGANDMGAEDKEQQNSHRTTKEAKSSSLQLTAGGLSSFHDVDSALAGFEQRYRQLDSRNQLMNRFHFLSKSDPSTEPRPANQRMDELRNKLQELRVFWKAAQEWDKEVEKRLRQSPVLVCIADLQRQAHFTLRAVSQCPKDHQRLLRQRINAFRQVFRQLFMVQSIMCLNAKGDMSEREGRKVPLVPYSPPQAHVWSNLFDTPVNIKPRDFSANCFGFEENHQKGGDASGDAPGFDPNDTMTSLGRLLRAGVLDNHAKVARQYALASRESHEMRNLLCNVIAWAQERLPISTKGTGPVVPAAVLAEQLDSQARQLETALHRSRPYPQLFNRQDGEIASEQNPPSGDVFFLGGFYKNLAESWLRRLRLMRRNLGAFMECQQMWLKLSPLLKSQNVPQSSFKELQKADQIFQSLAQSMAANPETRACLEGVLGSADGLATEACKYFMDAYGVIRQDLQDLRSRCFRLFFLEDEVLFELWGSSANTETQQQIVSRCLPQLFPGWGTAIFAQQLDSAGSHRSASKRSQSKKGTVEIKSDLVITAVQPTGPALQLLEPVPLHLPVQESSVTLSTGGEESILAALGVPRKFEALVLHSDRHFDALPSEHVTTIHRHVHGNHMAENWCPVIVENEVGERWAVHLDPLLIRQHRMKVRQELFDVQEKRSMMLRRIHEIRQSLPKAEPEESRKCWEKELKEAEHRRNEPLVRAFPPNIRHVTVFLEVSMHMVQLELVGRHLKEELWPRLVASQVECLTLVALDGREIEVEVTETGRASLTAFLDVLDPPPPRCLHSTQSQSRRSRSTGTAPELFMAPQLSKAIATDALLGHGAGLFVLCSKPADLEECEVLLKRSQLILQLCGVLGASPDDPEHSYERLVKAAAPGSALHLWFGAPYWDAFAAERRQHLEALRPLLQETQRLGGRLPAQLGVLGDGEVVSGAVLEIRLLERVMRECYVDEQRCEEELKILTQLLSKVSVVRRSPRQRDADEADQARSEVEPSVAPSLGLGLLDEPMWVQRAQRLMYPIQVLSGEWLPTLEKAVAKSFASLLWEVSQVSGLQEMETWREKGSLEPSPAQSMPEHVAVTAERIRWTSMVDGASLPDGMDFLSSYVEHRVREEVARNTAVSKDACAGAALMLTLELRELLASAKEQRQEAQQLKFLRMAWRSSESLAVELKPLILEFAWELYGGDELICPPTERCYVELAQQLARDGGLTCPVLQSHLGSTVTRAFAACCGIACHQCFILEPSHVRFCTGAGLLGHWVILHGIQELEQTSREACLKFLSKFFQQLSQSLEFFRDKMIDDPRLTDLSSNLRFAKLPVGSMKVHGVPMIFEKSKLLRRDRGRSRSCCQFEVERLEAELPVARSQSCPARQRTQSTSSLDFEVKAEIFGGIPRTMHPAVALFVAPPAVGETTTSWCVLRNLSFPPADLTLYIHAGLIRIGILDMDAARMLTGAVSAFNTFSEASKSTGRKGRHPHIGPGEIRSICAFAASLRRAHKSQDVERGTKELDEQILCEAWLCAIGTQLDAGPEREMLWRCTVMSFSRSAHFEVHQQAFRQNLFNDTLMAQRVAKKDLSTRFYIRIADTLRQKFSFDFYNPMVVQKCIATTQALLNDRDVAVVGEAGAGKTDCIMTMLEAAEDFPDDLGQPLFPKVKLMRINTLAHDVEDALLVVSRAAAEAQRKRRTEEQDEKSREDIWLTLDGPMNPELFESVAGAMPLSIMGQNKPYLPKTRAYRIIVETDYLARLSPATASSLAVTYIDTERGPTWKDRAMAWVHRFVLTCPEYAKFLELTKELLMHLMDSILAFVLYYFHFNPSEISAAATEGEALDYRHQQTTCFLSCFTSLLVDPVVEKQLLAATEEGQEALEREVRLLIGMSSISAFGASLFTYQRPRFEKYIRENVLDPVHAITFPPLYDLYLDSRTGQFQAVGKMVHLTEPILEAHNICVATEEFVAFQLRLRRLLAINAPVLLAGTAGSGKSALLRYLHGCKSPSTAGLLRTCPDLGPEELQQALTLNLSEQGIAGVLAPGNEKRLVVFIDDLHLSSIATTSWRLQAVSSQYRGPGSSGQSRLGEWIRFGLESQGFKRMEDGHFVAFRDVSFLPSLLAPNSQSLEVCKRFTRHFFLAFMEIPSEASIQKIFSTILTMNLTAGIPEEVMQNLTRNFWPMRLHPNVEIDTPGQKLAAQLLQATLAVWAETDLASKQRLHGMARVFWDVAHAFSRVPIEELHSQVEVGYLWAFVMRTSVLDALLLPEAASHRRRIYGAVARSCAGHFGLLLGGKAGLEDSDLQALELDSLAFSAISDGQAQATLQLATPGVRSLRRVNLAEARDGVLKRIGSHAYVSLREEPPEEKVTPSHTSQESDEGLDFEDSEEEREHPSREGEGGDSNEFSIDRKFKSQTGEDTEQAAPDPVSLAMCKELLTIDNEASLMWLLEEQTLCSLLRMCHILTSYPITCLVGGWTHLPLLGLAGKLLAGSSGGELHFCTGVTAESLERELLKTPVVLQQSRRKPQKVKAAQKKVEGGLRLLTISEEDFPASAPEAYLEREQRRFFRLGGGALGDERTPVCAKNGEVVEEEGQKRLVVICRSPASLQELYTRCGFLRQTLVATFHVLPPLSLQQVALVYLGNKLTSRIDLSALPKPQKKLIMHKSFFRGVQGARASIKKSTAKPTTTDDGQIWQQQLFIPLAKIVESLHLRIRDVMAVELGRDVALEFCSASRFSIFVQSIARLAMHHRSVQNHRGTMHESVRNRLKSLEKFLLDLDTKLRSMHVSLRLLAEESRRLLSRSAREHELQTQAKHSLAKVRERKHVVQSHIAAVDARHGNDLEKALGRANSSLRQLKQLERSHFESLAEYQHLPVPLVRALGAAKAVLLHICEEETEELNVPIFRRMAIPSHAQMAAVAAAGGAVGTPKVSKPPTRSETFAWAKLLAEPKSLDFFSAWDGNQPLPGWLAEVLQRFLISPDCHSSNLWSMSPAASRLSQWLHARLECHRVLMRMEDDRQSMGDLSTQLQEVTVAVATAEAELQRAAKTLERLEAAHAETVQQRQVLLRSEAVLQRQSARATRVLEIAAPRRRECEVVVPLLREAEESPEQWGAILTIGVLSCYGASFSHHLRQAIMKELHQVLQEGGVPTPSNLFTSAELGNFFPQSFVRKAVQAWPSSQQLQGAVAMEASGSLCTLMLDPFGSALEWLKELHTQRNPVASGGGDRTEFDKHLQRLMESRGIAQEHGDGDVLDDSENEWEDVPQAKATDQDCVQPLLCSGSETPEALTSKLQHCMLEGSIMIIELDDLSNLRGFVGTLLVLLSGSNAPSVRLTTERHSVLFHLSQRFTRALAINAGDASTHSVECMESEELRVRVFSMLQRLEAALPMVHYRFHLYVMAPRCPWSRSLWGPAKIKQAEQLMRVPSAIWSTCSIISMDPLPAHPAQAFLPSFIYAKEAPNAARKRQDQQLVLMAQETRLLVSEELILHLLGKMENSDMQSDKVVRPLQKFHACASRLARSVSMGLQERQQRRKAEKKFLPLASTVALLQAALIDSELATEAVKGLFTPVDITKDRTKDLVRDVNKEVDGFAMRPLVLQALLQHQLKLHSSAKDAVSELMEIVVCALGPSQGSLFRLFLLLESREQGLSSLWHSMVTAMTNKVLTLDTSKTERRQSTGTVKTSEVALSASGDGGSSEEDEKSSDDTDDEDEDSDSDSDSDTDSENQAGEEDGQGEDGQGEEDEVDDFMEDDLLEVVPAAKILSIAMMRRIKEMWNAVKATVPMVHPKRTAKQQLARLPSKTPLLVPFDALPLLQSLAKSLSVKVQDFRELEAMLVSHLEGTRRKKTGRRGAKVQDLIAGQAVAVALFREMLEGQDQPYKEPTRWILYCSAETVEIPKSILRFCFCIQNVMTFFGIGENIDLAHLPSSLVDDLDLQATARQAFELVGRWGLVSSPLLREALGYIAQRHPLLTVCSSFTDEKQSNHLLSSMVVSIKAAGLQHLSFLNRASLTDWVEEELIMHALPWTQERWIGSVLQSFSPTLTYRSDGETYRVLGALSMKISEFLQLLASALLTLDSPFWLRLELNRAIRALQDARRECIACHAALAGDASWTSQLYAVYKSAQLGMAYWANRPLASWLNTWSEHTNFLADWDPKSPLDSKPFRLASVNDISTVLSSYYREGGPHYLWLEEVSARERGSSPDAERQTIQLLVEGLQLVGAGWDDGLLVHGGHYEGELPPVVIRLCPGRAPTSEADAWYLCPVVVASQDAFGADLLARPVAHVYVRTSSNAALCALHGVRLVCFA
ncbi:Dynein axonemal heavy chain 9 (Axonemal beta dynein heavy chain 9) (Ciliary dynein heavy chain 9), partial [Durusdinium trenchii]